MQYEYVNYMQYDVKQCNNAMRVAGLAVFIVWRYSIKKTRSFCYSFAYSFARFV